MVSAANEDRDPNAATRQMAAPMATQKNAMTPRML